jgi:hypothetical protein
MIILDNVNHKIDVEYNKDNFLHITVFHKKTTTEWTTKIIGLSPEVQSKLVEIIVAKQKELAENAYYKEHSKESQ